MQQRWRRLFAILNRWLMVPAFRLGLGPLLGNPVTGYIMVLRTRGQKTGRTRWTPVNFAIMDGSIYCIAGFGPRSHWYGNLRAHPRVECQWPGGACAGTAATVTDPAEWARALRAVLINAGLAGRFYGYNPRTVPDGVLRERARVAVVVRIRPEGVGSGAGDPGGLMWVWGLAAITGLAYLWLR